ncbi:MAG: aminopeptidase P N-terminal domain-containing protein [Chitinophagales bacterium]|nr:aminopeptidase P N-terminal domain-containing protein [Chitinophagales bacterium]
MIQKNRYPNLNPQLFIDNRKRLAKHLPKNAMAILFANDEMPRTGDAYYDFKQNSNFFYLTGIDQEQCAFIFYPDCPNPKFRTTLFLRKTNEHIAVWEGYKYTIEDAKKISGIDTIVWIDSFDDTLAMLMTFCSEVFININENDRALNYVAYKDIRFGNELRQMYPAHQINRLEPIMKKLRAVKSKQEIELIAKACNITRDAFNRVLHFVQPNVNEYEVEAEIIHEFIRQGATGHAYTPIIASGKNACVLHYINNNNICKDGDLLLMDFGAQYANYNADLTRTIPVNGKFTARQKAVYNAVLKVMKHAKKILKPGVLLSDYQDEVGKVMEAELIQLKLLDKTAVKNQDKDNPLYKQYFMHGTSHHLGLDVHDTCDRFAPVQIGNVFTVEPGIYIPKENIGIRIENDIVIGKTKNTDLMADIPIEVEEIESIMQGKKRKK